MELLNDELGQYAVGFDGREGGGQSHGGGGVSEEDIRGLGFATTEVTDLFFSRRNLDGLQAAIRYQCYLETGAVIGRQSDNEVLVIMRRVLQEGREGGDCAGGPGGDGRSGGVDVYAQSRGGHGSEVTRSLMALNEAVLAVAVPEVVGAYRAHAHYLRDIAQPVAVPLEHAQYMGSRNTGDKLHFPGLM